MHVIINDGFLNYSQKTNKNTAVFRSRMLPRAADSTVRGSLFELGEVIYRLCFRNETIYNDSVSKRNSFSRTAKNQVSPQSTLNVNNSFEKHIVNKEAEEHYPETQPYIQDRIKQQELIKALFIKFNSDLSESNRACANWRGRISELLEEFNIKPLRFKAFDNIPDEKTYKKTLKSITRKASLENFEMFVDLLINGSHSIAGEYSANSHAI